MYSCNGFLQQQRFRQQVRGLSTQGNDNSSNESNSQQCDSNTPIVPSATTQQDGSSYQGEETPSNDGVSNAHFLETKPVVASGTACAPSHSTTPVSQNPSSSSFMNMEHSEALQHLEKALSACEATLTETQGMVKMEPDEQFTQQHEVKPYSMSMVPSSNCNPSSPFPAIEGKQKISEEEWVDGRGSKRESYLLSLLVYLLR